MYPDTHTCDRPHSPLSGVSVLLHLPSSDALTSQMRHVTLQLQCLLRNIHRRHGTNHPVFQWPIMPRQFIHDLLNKDVDDMDTNCSERHQYSQSSTCLTSVSNARHDAQCTASEPMSPHSLPASVSSFTAPHWTCACGSSFRVTSNRSIQKHMASCDVQCTTRQRRDIQ